MKRFLVFASILLVGLALAATVASTSPENDGSSAVHSAAAMLGFENRVREVTIPAGMVLHLRLNRGFGSDTSRVEDRVTAELVRTISIEGRDALPAGSTATGYVTTSRRAGKVKGRAKVGVRFDGIEPPDGGRYSIVTRPWVAEARATKSRDALKIGVPAAGGAAIGALLGGKKGAGIGALIGGGGGTAVVLTTRGRDVHVGRGATLAVRLAAPLTVRVPR